MFRFIAFFVLSFVFSNFAYSALRLPEPEPKPTPTTAANESTYRPNTAANDPNYRTPKPLPKPGGLVGGIAGAVIIDTIIDVIDKTLDKTLDPKTHEPERYPTNGCGSYGDVRQGKGVGLSEYANNVCRHHTGENGFSVKEKVFMQSGKGVTYYLQCTKHPFSFSVSCYAYDEVRNPDPNSNPDDYFKPTPTPTTPNNPAPNPNNSPNDNPNSDPNNNPNPNTNPNTNPQNDPNSNPNSDDDPNNNPNNNPNNDPKKDPKANPNSKDDPNNENDKDKQKDEQDKPKQGTKDEPKPFELSKFCSWAKWFCEDDLKNDKDTEIEPEQLKIPTDKVNIKFNAQCPATQHFPFTIAGYKFSFAIDWVYLCQVASNLGGFVKFLSSIVALFILSGIKR